MTTKNPVFPEKKVHSTTLSFFKRSLLLISFVSISVLTYAQGAHREPINPRHNKLEYQGYTIRVIPALGGTLGYDITKDNKRLVHQYINPLPGLRLMKKEDVYKVAEWTIQQYTKTGHFPPMIPSAIVKELKLSSNH